MQVGGARILRRQFLAAGAARAFSPEHNVVWRAGEGGYPTISHSRGGARQERALLAFCEGRRGGSGDSGDNDLLTRRSTDGGGKSWKMGGSSLSHARLLVYAHE